MATYQSIAQKLLQDSDYYKKVIALTRKRQEEEKNNPKKSVKVINFTEINNNKNKIKAENDDILGYYWFPPIN